MAIGEETEKNRPLNKTPELTRYILLLVPPFATIRCAAPREFPSLLYQASGPVLQSRANSNPLIKQPSHSVAPELSWRRRSPMTSNSLDSRQNVRCTNCLLVQFLTTDNLCRRCSRPLNRLGISNISALPLDASSAKALTTRVGAILRSSRKERRLSQEQVARSMGVKRSYISRIERGRSSPSLYSLHRAASALGMDLAELFIRLRSV
jgi:DNA-binding XRE family transcriptional regulator